MTNRPKNALEWFKLYSQGEIQVSRLEDDDKPKKIYIYQQIDPKTDEVIKEYHDLKELPISESSIYKCIKNPEKVTKGYKWKRILQSD